MQKNIVLFLAFVGILFGLTAHLAAQDAVRRCGADQFRAENPPTKILEARPNWRNFVPVFKISEVKYRIPVVFHVIHMNGPENISDAQIESQIEVLNEDFQRKSGTPGFGNGANPGTEFYLARLDPNGEPTNGINRIWSPFTFQEGGDSRELESLITWDPESYANIWVANSLGNNALAYANVGPNGGFDGVVISAKNIGRIGAIDAPYDGGRTLTHEMGHWLGVFHPFQDGCRGWSSSDCDIAGDFCCDTPQYMITQQDCKDGSASACPEFYNDPNIVIPVENYMGYSPDNCYNAFTACQVGRMDSVLVNHRQYIYSERNLVATGYYRNVSRSGKYGSSSVFGYPFPNPCSGICSVSTDVREPVTYSVSDLSGRTVLSGTTSRDDEAYLQIHLETLSPGIYQLSLSTGIQGEARSFRLIRMNP